MAETKFDSKSFNPQAFGAYVNRIPNTTKTELAKSGAVGANEQAREVRLPGAGPKGQTTCGFLSSWDTNFPFGNLGGNGVTEYKKNG